MAVVVKYAVCVADPTLNTSRSHSKQSTRDASHYCQYACCTASIQRITAYVSRKSARLGRAVHARSPPTDEAHKASVATVCVLPVPMMMTVLKRMWWPPLH